MRDTVFPFSEPVAGVDGSMTSELPIARGQHLVVAARSSNRSDDVWAQALRQHLVRAVSPSVSYSDYL